MMIIDVDYHPSFQVIAFLIEETGEYEGRELNTVMEVQNGFIETCTTKGCACG